MPGSRTRKGLAVCALALGLASAAGWGAYVAAQGAAEQAFAQAVERLRAARPPDLTLEHGAVTADPLSGRITVADVALGPRNEPQERLRAPLVVLDGIRPNGAGLATLSADNLTLTVQERRQPHRLMALSSLRVSGLSLPAAGEPFDLGAIRLDSAEATGLAITPAKQDSDPGGTIGRLAVSGIGGDRPDSLVVEALDISMPPAEGFTRARAARITGSNIRLVSMIQALMADQIPPVPPGRSEMALEGLVIDGASGEMLRVDRISSDSDDVGGNPNRKRGALAIEGLAVTLPPALGPFSLGYTRLQLALAAAVEADVTAGDYRIESFRLALPEVATVELALEMTGMQAPPAGDPMRTGRLHGFTFRYTDAGLVIRALEEGAKQGGMRAEELRRQIAEASPMLFSGPGSERNVAALRRFLERPGTLEVTARPAAPVALSDLERQGSQGPDAVVRMLNIAVTAN